jgi:hypothetical protein
VPANGGGRCRCKCRKKKFIKKGVSTPQALSFPSLPPVNPRTTSYPQETLQGRASFRLPTYDFTIVHVFCARISQSEKFHKKNLKTPAKKTKSQPTHTKKKKKIKTNKTPSLSSLQKSQDAEPVSSSLTNSSLTDLPTPNPTDFQITRPAFDLPGLLCLQ